MNIKEPSWCSDTGSECKQDSCECYSHLGKMDHFDFYIPPSSNQTCVLKIR